MPKRLTLDDLRQIADKGIEMDDNDIIDMLLTLDSLVILVRGNGDYSTIRKGDTLIVEAIREGWPSIYRQYWTTQMGKQAGNPVVETGPLRDTRLDHFKKPLTITIKGEGTAGEIVHELKDIIVSLENTASLQELAEKGIEWEDGSLLTYINVKPQQGTDNDLSDRIEKDSLAAWSNQNNEELLKQLSTDPKAIQTIYTCLNIVLSEQQQLISMFPKFSDEQHELNKRVRYLQDLIYKFK